jgi:hypothetical protein
MNANGTYCPNCGTLNPAGSQTCSNCGAPLMQVASSQSAVPPPPQNMPPQPPSPQSMPPQPPPAQPYTPPPPVASAPYQTPPPAKKGGFPWLTCGIILVIVLCIGALATAGVLYFTATKAGQIASNITNSIQLTAQVPGGLVSTIEAIPTLGSALETSVPPSGNCQYTPPADMTPSTIITKITMAEDTSGSQKDPVNPTTEFSPSATVHAVVAIKNAPSGTKFTATWYATDVGKDNPCNTKIDSTDLTTDGTRNIDFSLSPSASWLTGEYRVEIYVDDTLSQVVSYTVK